MGQVSGSLDHPTPAQVLSTYFRGNSAGDPGGGGLYMLDDVSLDSCVFYENLAVDEAGGGACGSCTFGGARPYPAHQRATLT